MKKLGLSLIAALSLAAGSVQIAEAHPGRTDSSGGHTCWTNCAKWGYEKGEYHYHNGGSSSSSSGSSNNYVSTPTKQDTTPVLTSVDVYINDVWQNYDPSAYVKNGTTLVPMRAIFEDLGAKLQYNNKTKTITAYKDKKEISIAVGNKKAYIKSNGVTSAIKLTNPAEIHEGATMVPLRFISETLGANIKWDSDDLAVYISTKSKAK
jgi:hypothetical protein